MKKLLFVALAVGLFYGAWSYLPSVEENTSGLNADDNAINEYCMEIGLGCFAFGLLAGAAGVLWTSVGGGRALGLIFGVPAILASVISLLAVLILSDDCAWAVLLPLGLLWVIPLLFGGLSVWRGYRRQPVTPREVYMGGTAGVSEQA